MPELPEVEIVKQSLSKKIEQKRIKKVIIKNRNLRFKIPLKFEKLLEQKKIKKVTRFSKYLILNFNDNSFCLKIPNLNYFYSCFLNINKELFVFIFLR